MFFSAAPRFEIPESYVDGLIFRHEEIIRLKIPMIAKPTPKVKIILGQYHQYFYEQFLRVN